MLTIDYSCIFYTTSQLDPSQVIAIRGGETGYFNTDHEPDMLPGLNGRSGWSAAQIEAATVCSMFDNWPAFHDITANLEKRAAK